MDRLILQEGLGVGPMIYDRLITISAAGSRRAIHWPAQTLLWSELAARLQMPVRGEESHAEYMRWPKQLSLIHI